MFAKAESFSKLESMRSGFSEIAPLKLRLIDASLPSVKKIAFTPIDPVALDDHELMVQIALSGAALAYVWEKRAEREIMDGKLVRCLDQWCAPEDWLYLCYPSRKNMSAGLRAVN